LYVIGMTRNPKAPQVRTLAELASTDADRIVLNSIANASDIGRSIFAPPNVPAERVTALRKAFQELIRDPDFIREADRRSVPLEPLPGDELQSMVTQSMNLTPALVERIHQTIRP